MYDTINFWLSLEKTSRFDLDKILQNLSGITEHKQADEQNYISGLLGKNYKVNISPIGISLKGSLAKYYLNDNFKTLTRFDSEKAIEKLSDELHLPIHLAKLSRIDFAQNLLMDFAPEAYYSYLGESLYYNRLIQPKSIYYTNGLRQKLFYNKIAEGNAKALVIPDVWKGQNVLRFETRWTSRLPKQFNTVEVNASSLSNEKFYMDLFDKWQQEYNSINKLQSINFNLSNMNSPKDFWKQLSLLAINSIGQENIMQEIENLRNQKAFDKPEYYSRLKKEIKDLCNEPALTEKSDLITELDKKIIQAKKYYR